MISCPSGHVIWLEGHFVYKKQAMDLRAFLVLLHYLMAGNRCCLDINNNRNLPLEWDIAR